MTRFFTALASFLTLACVQPAATHAQSLPHPHSIGGDRLHAILRPDAIPSIDQPRFVRASEATFMRDDEPVVGAAHAWAAFQRRSYIGACGRGFIRDRR